MSLILDCDTVEVINPTLPSVAIVSTAAAIIELSAPSLVVEAINPVVPEFIETTFPDSVLPVLLVPGPPGPPGGGGGGAVELFDTNTPNPPGAPFPYLRFERDLDGDVQAVYLGTAT